MDDAEEQVSGAEEEGAGRPEPKISFVVGILGMTTAIVMDALSIVPGAGDLEEIPAGVTLALSAITGLGPTVLTVQAVAMGIKALPIIQALPVWTVAWGATWWIGNHPSKLGAAVEQTATIAAAAEGGGAAGGASGVAGAAEEAEELAGTGAAAATTAETMEETGAAAGSAATAESVATEGSGVEIETGESRRVTDIEEGHAEPSGEERLPNEDEGSPEEEERKKKEKEIDKGMRLGAEVPPEEQLEEELFDPEGSRFRQARDISARKDEEEGIPDNGGDAEGAEEDEEKE